jgi:hypothetical protein
MASPSNEEKTSNDRSYVQNMLKISPMYLINACPQLTRDRTNYDLRSGMNITMPQKRTTTKKLF